MPDVLVLVERLRDRVDEIVGHVGAAVDRVSSSRDRGDRPIDAADEPERRVMLLQQECSRQGGPQVRGDIEIREVVLLQCVVPRRVLRRVEEGGPADDDVDVGPARVAA